MIAYNASLIDFADSWPSLGTIIMVNTMLYWKMSLPLSDLQYLWVIEHP